MCCLGKKLFDPLKQEEYIHVGVYTKCGSGDESELNIEDDQVYVTIESFISLPNSRVIIDFSSNSESRPAETLDLDFEGSIGSISPAEWIDQRLHLTLSLESDDYNIVGSSWVDKFQMMCENPISVRHNNRQFWY